MAIRGGSKQTGGRGGEKWLDSGSNRDNRVCLQVGRKI